MEDEQGALARWHCSVVRSGLMYPFAPTNQVGTCQRGFCEERESDCPSGPEGPIARSQFKIFSNEPLLCGISYAEWVLL